MATVFRPSNFSRPYVVSSIAALSFTAASSLLILTDTVVAPMGQQSISQPLKIATNYNSYIDQPPNTLTNLLPAFVRRGALTARPGYPNYNPSLQSYNGTWQNTLPLYTVALTQPPFRSWIEQPQWRISSQAALDWKSNRPNTFIGSGPPPQFLPSIDVPVQRVSSIAALDWKVNRANTFIGGGLQPITPPVWVNPNLRISSVASSLSWLNSWQNFLPIFSFIPPTPPPFLASTDVPVRRISSIAALDWKGNNANTFIGGGIKPFTPVTWPNPILRSYSASLDWRLGQALTIIGGGLKPITPPVWVNPVLRIPFNNVYYQQNVTIRIPVIVEPTCYETVYSIMRDSTVPVDGVMNDLPVGVFGEMC